MLQECWKEIMRDDHKVGKSNMENQREDYESVRMRGRRDIKE